MVMTMSKGYSTGYLLDEVGPGLDAAVNESAAAYYTGAVDQGEPPGLWWGAGAESLGLAGTVERDVMQGLYEYQLDPRDPNAHDTATWGRAKTLVPQRTTSGKVEDAYQALLAAHPQAGPEERAVLRAQAVTATRPAGVAFDDLTFSPPKSVTVLWAACAKKAADARSAGAAARSAGDLTRAAGAEQSARLWSDRAARIEQSVLAAHRAGLQYLQATACYVRTGHHGVDRLTGEPTGKWLNGRGLIATQFLQHDSRERDPQLHVHGPIKNLAQGEDGKWRGLDRARLRAGLPAASAIAHRTLEADLTAQLGLEFRTRPDGVTREIVGVGEESKQVYSSRRHKITPATAELIAQFRDELGREPTADERAALAQRATLATRPPKAHTIDSQEDTLTRWAAKHRAEVQTELAQVADEVFGREAAPVDTWSERDVITRALAAAEQESQAFSRDELMRHLSDALPGNLGLPAGEVRALLEGLADRALGVAVRLSPEPADADLPAELRRADGASVFANPRPVQYATRESLAGEQALREAAVLRGAPVLSARAVEEVLGEYADAGTPLGADQAAALRGIATSGARLEVLAAPAGTGKTFAVGALARMWREQGAGRVRAIAFGQLQADELAAEGVTSRNIRHWLVGQQRLAEGRPVDDDEEFRLRGGDLIVVDETQLAGTGNLAEIQHRCAEAGAKLLLTGDTAQGGMGPSGALSDLVDRAKTYELVEVRRFVADWEGPASLRLRDGDTGAISDYVKHGRREDAGAIERAEDAAARAWLADTIAGKESLVVCASNAGAARVCATLRAELVSLGKVEEAGVPLAMQGTFAGVGDLIQARHADRSLGLVNRTRFRVQQVHPDGSLTAAPVSYGPGGETLGEARDIPAGYVREHVALGYASTQAAAIGRTVDTCYGVVTPGVSRASTYVMATRGREMNRLFMVTQAAPDDAVAGETAQAPHRDATGMLTELISRPPDSVAELTALAQAELAEAAAGALPAAVEPLVMTLSDLTHARTGQLADQLAAVGELSERDRIALANDPATRSLTQLLRTAELAGHDPARVLGDALAAKSLAKSHSVAQVLHARIRRELAGELTARVGSFQDLIPADAPAGYRPVLQGWAAAADARRYELGARAAADPPAWARSLGPVPDDLLGRADWEQKAGWVAAYREWVAGSGGPLDENDPLGAAPARGLIEKRAVWQTAHDALGLVDGAAEEEDMREGQLRARVAAWEREKNWAPPYVADQLEATHQALYRAQADALIWAARAEATDDAGEKAQLSAAANQARAEAERFTQLLPQLQEADDARDRWRTHTVVTRENATRSRAALEIRGIDADSADDRVTAAEWMQAHLAEQAEADQHREIRDDHDLASETEPTREIPAPAEADREPPVTEREDDGQVELETEVPDIRDTSEADPSETVDRPGRVPLVDEAAQAVERARAAVAEIEARTAWEAEQADEEATGAPPLDESARAVELNRFAADDRAAQSTDPAMVDS